MGLAIFASDALSSSAYATDEILYALVGVISLHSSTEANSLASNALDVSNLYLSVPVALAIATLLGIVIVSYRQVIKAYPDGGGAYVVAKDNLGTGWSLVAASALIIDYVLTVAVSVSAGVAAVMATFHEGGTPLLVEQGASILLSVLV